MSTSGSNSEGLRVTPPYDSMDLSDIVTNINRSTSTARKRCANDKVTRAFLQAALSLTDELFSTGASSNDEEDEPRPTMSYLSTPKVLMRAKEIHPEVIPTLAKFRDRWTAQRNFLADFITYALTARHWSLSMALSQQARQLLISGADFPTAVHEVAYEDLLLVLDFPVYRFQLLAIASAQTDSVAADALSAMYENLSTQWCNLYREVFEHHNIKLRPGLSIDDFNIILQATAEGLALRLISGTDEPILDHNQKRSLLGTAAMALVLSFIDPGDGRPLDALVSDAFRSPSTS